jgi:nitroreductase
MDFSELVQRRYSVRGYASLPVEDEKVALILEAARLAPTAANRQPFRLVVIRDAARREAMRAAYSRDRFVSAPLMIAACGVPQENWVRKDGKNYNDVDVAIVMDYVTLQATDLGLGTCWIADFDAAAAREVLDLPAGVDPVALTPVGYPSDEPRPKKRRSLSELVRWETYS